MSAPSLQTGYDHAKHVQASRSDCHITVGFDRQRGHIPRFLVQLHYQVATDPVQWRAIARMDHNETSTQGHDVYREGLHVDVARRTQESVHLHIPHGHLPATRGTVIRRCAGYLNREADYFVDVYEGRHSPGRPPGWSPDGGDPSFICEHIIEVDMSQESPTEDALTLRELSEVLADVEGTTPEEIERGAAEIEIAPPEEASVVDE